MFLRLILIEVDSWALGWSKGMARGPSASKFSAVSAVKMYFQTSGVVQNLNARYWIPTTTAIPQRGEIQHLTGAAQRPTELKELKGLKSAQVKRSMPVT
ncbi:hypothetical protein BKM32_16275 [Mangrovimonas sp. DI 80]|nr:hypothetical protein BKM32_16275 [Mangrovimonas sp. DI 80]